MTLQQTSSRLSEQLSEPEAQSFDYAALDPETRIVVQQRTSEIKSLIRRTASDILDLGQKLLEVKAQLGHGYFRDWLKSEFDWGVWTATKYMQVAKRFKCVNFSHLDIAPSALYELAAPSTPETARDEAIKRAFGGETITHSKAKAIKARAITQKEQEPVQYLPELVTIDVNAETVGRELPTEPGTKNNLPDPTSSTSNPQSNDLEQKQREKALGRTCAENQSPLEALSHEQIDALWQALAHCTSFEQLLALHNWSNSQLKRLNAAIGQELNKRHHTAQL